MNKYFSDKYTILVSLAVFVVSVWLCWRIGLSLTVPLVEARELATVSAGLSMKEGSFGLLPDNIYFYGPLHPLLLSLIPQSWDIVLINRLASLLFVIGSSFIIVLAVKRWLKWKGRQAERCTMLLSFLGYLYPFFIELEGLATPAYLGVLIANVILLLSLCKFRGKYVLLALLLILASQTKPYFALSGIYILASLLFVDDKKSLLSNISILVLCSILFALPFMCLEQTWLSVIHCMNTLSSSLYVGISKIIYYGKIELPEICVIGSAGTLLLCKRWVVFFKETKHNHRNLISSFIKYVLSENFAPNAYVILITLLNILFLIRIGSHSGHLGCLYHIQLASASFILLLNLVLSDENLNQRLCCGFYATLLCIWVPLWEVNLWNRTPLQAFDRSLERSVQSDIKSGLRIRHSAISAIYEFSQTGKISDNGQLQYLHTVSISPSLNNSTFCAETNKKIDSYTSHTIQSIQNRTWDVIYTDCCSFVPNHYGPQSSRVYLNQLLEENYRCVDEFYAPILRQNDMKVSRWIKRCPTDTE